jgi:hypothetical protein
MNPNAQPAKALSAVQAPTSQSSAPTASVERQEQSDGRGLFRVVLALEGLGERTSIAELAHNELYQSGQISQSTIDSLVVLAAFVLGEARRVTSTAVELGMSITTTWRYIKRWVAVGVLEERGDRHHQLARRWIADSLESAEPRLQGLAG